MEKKKQSSQKENLQKQGQITKEGWRKLQDLGEGQELYCKLQTVKIMEG